MKIMVTGVAGFIGMHVARLLLLRGDIVIGIDNINDYYDVQLKLDRLDCLGEFPNFKIYKGDITNQNFLKKIFEAEGIARVIHLAAQPGVRYSLENPHAYINSNIVGFCNVLEECRKNSIEHLVYASSSSVYGANTKIPFATNDRVDHPVSLYAATKKANELMAHTYSHLYGLPTTGLRYFSVYGPWGRPDMAPWLFTKAILDGRPINIFNEGKMLRDFTYVEDIARGTIKAIDKVSAGSVTFSTSAPIPSESYAPYKIYNIGNQQPIELMVFIQTLERALGIKALKSYLPMQPGDLVATFADVHDFERDFEFSPEIELEQGIDNWVQWYLDYIRS